METYQVFPGQQKGQNLWETLRAVAREFGYSITNEECLAECKQLVQDGLLSNQTMMVAGQKHDIGQSVHVVISVFRQRLQQGHKPSAGRRTISLPWDRRRGAEIRLTEEQAQLAMSPVPSAALHTQLQELFGLMEPPTPVMQPKMAEEYPPEMKLWWQTFQTSNPVEWKKLFHQLTAGSGNVVLTWAVIQAYWESQGKPTAESAAKAV